MAAKQLACDMKKLRHCHPVYTALRKVRRSPTRSTNGHVIVKLLGQPYNVSVIEKNISLFDLAVITSHQGLLCAACSAISHQMPVISDDVQIADKRPVPIAF